MDTQGPHPVDHETDVLRRARPPLREPALEGDNDERPSSASALAVSPAWRRIAACALLLFAMTLDVPDFPHIDLYPTYVAARLANQGSWDHIYHPTVYLHGNEDPGWQPACAALQVPCNFGTSFTAHPWYLKAVQPIVDRLAYPAFQKLITWLNKAAIIAVGFELAALVGLQSVAFQLLMTILVEQAGATIWALHLGQNTVVALGFSLASLRMLRTGRNLWVATLLIMLACCCKTWCMPLLCFVFWERGVRAGLLASGVFASVMLVLPQLVLPTVLMQTYYAMTAELSRMSIVAWNNLAILSQLERFAGSPLSHDYIPRHPSLALRMAALIIAGLVGLAAAALVWRRRPSREWVAAALLAYLVLPPGVSWDHYFLFTLPLAALAAFGGHQSVGLRIAGFAVIAEQLALHFVTSPNPLPSIADNPALRRWLLLAPMTSAIALVLLALWRAPVHEHARRALRK
jgi:hypothetical protein